MKLRNLNGAIRKVEGPIKISLSTCDGVLEIDVVKSTLIENMKTLYGEDNTVETALRIDGNRLRHEDGSPFGDTHGERELANLEQSDEDLDLLGGVTDADADEDDDELNLLD